MILEWEEDNCKERNAYCFRFNQKCICQCSHGYVMVNGHCLEGKTSLKINFLCVLPSKIYFKCNYNFNFIVYSIIYFILDLVSLNNICISDRQCTLAGHSHAVCINGICECQHGYISKDEICYPGNQRKE